MIRSFADRSTRELFETGRSQQCPPDVWRRAVRTLDALDRAGGLGDLAALAGNRLHKLSGDRRGQYAVAVNRQWRICFRWLRNDAHDVEFCDYH